MHSVDQTCSFSELDLARSQMPRRSWMSSLRIPISRTTHHASIYIYTHRGIHVREHPCVYTFELSLRMPDIYIYIFFCLKMAVPLGRFPTEVPGGHEAGCSRISSNPGSVSLGDLCKNFGQVIAVFSTFI